MLSWGQFCSFGQLVLGNRGQWVVTGAPAHLHPLCACTPSLSLPLPFAPPPCLHPSLLALSACPPPPAACLLPVCTPSPVLWLQSAGGCGFPTTLGLFSLLFSALWSLLRGEGCLWFSRPIRTPGSFRRVSILVVSPAQPTIQLHFWTICGQSSSLL